MKMLACIVLLIFQVTPYLVLVSTSPTTTLQLSTNDQTSATTEPVSNITSSPDEASTQTGQPQTSTVYTDTTAASSEVILSADEVSTQTSLSRTSTVYKDTTEASSEITLSSDDVSTQNSQSQTRIAYTDTTETAEELNDENDDFNGENQIKTEGNLSSSNNHETSTVREAHDPINNQSNDVIQLKTTYIDSLTGNEDVQNVSNSELNGRAIEINLSKDGPAKTLSNSNDLMGEINRHKRGKDPDTGNSDPNTTEVVTDSAGERTYETTTVEMTTTMRAKTIQFDSIRLPQSIRPSTYEITMKPYIYENTAEPFKYDCKTVINITCSEETDVIKLHAVQHEIINIQLIDVTDDATDLHIVHFELDTPTAMLGILLESPMKTENQYILSIESTGLITDSLQGFYRSPYKVGNQTRYIVTTMMEPTDARMVFPCFDEPDFKAVFLFYIYRKDGFTCLTNLPKRESIGPDVDGFYLDIFDQPRNVPMSTYLVAIAIGDLAFEEDYFRDVPFRTWSRSNAAHLTLFSLDIGVRTMEFFEDYFKVKYPLPKQDMIAVPTMSFNAMEHWGLITCREESMFYEEGVSSASDMEWTAVLVAHETSHQWFGNIVSPKWWDELWLNEGFATYMMILAVDKVIPEWEMMTKMVVDYRGTQSVMGVDDTLTSHPVYVPVEHPSEIGEIFDLISYAKGSAVIRMMNFILGDDTFRDGLTRFLNTHSYDTATNEDLWKSLREQAVEDNNIVTDVQGIMDNWIKEMNYPVVMVTRSGSNVCLKQFAFLLSQEERQNRSHVFWEIPFTYTSDTQTSFAKESRDIVWLKKDGHIRCFQDQLLENSKWIVGNIKQYGYFRVNYDNENWKAILRQLSENHEVIHPMNRAQIINDAWNLASAGLLDFEIALGTFDYLDEELHFVPWKAAILNLQYIERSLQHFPIYGDFKKFMRNKIQKAFFNSAGARTHNEKIRYTMIGYEACQYDLKACVDDALERFNDWMTDENVLVNPDMKATVYCMGVKKGGTEAWEFVLDKYLHTESSTERRFLVEALACTEEPWLLSKLSNIVLHSPADYFLSTDKILAISEMATTSVGRLFAWNVIEEHWDLLFEKYGTELNLFPRLISAITRSFNFPYELRRLERLAEEKQNNSVIGPRLFASVISHVRTNIRWIGEHYSELEQWIQKGL